MRAQIALKELEEELNKVMGTWQYCQALKTRNQSQAGSFVDENAQWDSQSDEDRYYLSILPQVESKMEELIQKKKLLTTELEKF